jgi:hypothetical protein
MQVDAPLGELVVEAGLGRILHPAQHAAADPEQVDLHSSRQSLQQVGARDPAAADRLVDGRRGARQAPAVAIARVHDSVLDHSPGRGPGVPEQVVEMGHVHQRQVGAVRGGVAHLGDAALRGVVLEVDRRQVAARAPPGEPALAQAVELAGPLEDHHVDVELGRLGRSHLDRRGRPLPGERPTATVGAAIVHPRQVVVVLPLDQRGGVGAVHVPEQDPHVAPS